MIGYIFSLSGRSSRRSMVLITVLFLGLNVLRQQLGIADALSNFLFAMQIAMLWPAQIALPIRRFHDMGRSWWWVCVFWGGALIGVLFTHWGLGQTGPFVGMTAHEIWQSPQSYVDAIAAFNATRAPEEAVKLLNGAGMGGISLAMIFLAIQFGWLHIIPGRDAPNRFGAPISAVSGGLIGESYAYPNSDACAVPNDGGGHSC